MKGKSINIKQNKILTKILIVFLLMFLVFIFSKTEVKAAEVIGDFYELDNEYVTRVLPETTYLDLKNNFEDDNIKVKKDGVEISQSEYVGSGMTLEVNNNIYTLSVIGDLDGNGKLTITDLIKLRLSLSGITKIEEKYKKSADINNSNSITITDLAQLNLCMVRSIDIIAPKSFIPAIETSKDTISVTGKTSDSNNSTIEYYFKLDNGEWVQNTEKQNGSYTFTNVNLDNRHTIRMKVKDSEGNQKKTSEIIVKHEKAIEIIPSVTGWTNKDIIVAVQFNSNVDNTKNMISLDGGNTFAQYVRPQVIRNNTTIVAQILNDKDEKLEEERLEIKNIDKLEPKGFTPTITRTGNTISISATTGDADATENYGMSGIKEYEYILKQDNWQWKVTKTSNTQTFNNLRTSENYTVEVVAIDNAGNRRSIEIENN